MEKIEWQPSATIEVRSKVYDEGIKNKIFSFEILAGCTLLLTLNRLLPLTGSVLIKNACNQKWL